MNQDEITFIVPTIGRETLSRSITSLLNQTDSSWKCIIVFDDVPIIECIIHNGQPYSLVDDKRFTLLWKDKMGKINDDESFGRIGGQAGLVRNHGLEIANTKWIGFLDDDDSLNPNYVEMLKAKYAEYDVVIWRMIYDFGKILPYPDSDELRWGTVGISFCYKNTFKDQRVTANDQGEDLIFLTSLLQKTNNYVITPEVMYNVGH